MPVLAYIALGANLGNREANIRSALDKLAQTPGIALTKISTLLENSAVGGPADSPAFLNGAAELLTSLPPAALLARLLQIEREVGRVRRERWGPRAIDLDLLLYGGQVLHESGLSVPHPLMHERRFVLEPLAQIAADVPHPVRGRTIGQLLADLPPAGD